jgi:hypothetical protein
LKLGQLILSSTLAHSDVQLCVVTISNLIYAILLCLVYIDQIEDKFLKSLNSNGFWSFSFLFAVLGFRPIERLGDIALPTYVFLLL